MGDDAEPTSGADAGASKGKGKKEKKAGRSNLLPAVVLAIGLTAGGYFMGGSGGSSTAGAESSATTTEPPGEIATMDPISVNLADGHFLKVGLGVQLSESADAENFPKGPMSKVKDLLISEVGGADMATLSTDAGREALKAELTKQAAKEFDGEVLGFYFTDFVMQ
jgi:flagellar FliL protein